MSFRCLHVVVGSAQSLRDGAQGGWLVTRVTCAAVALGRGAFEQQAENNQGNVRVIKRFYFVFILVKFFGAASYVRTGFFHTQGEMLLTGYAQTPPANPRRLLVCMLAPTLCTAQAAHRSHTRYQVP